MFLANSAQAAAVYIFINFDGHDLTNFDGPGSGTNAGSGTNMNGIANTGAAVGFGIANNGSFTNFVRNPSVVGAPNGNAFFLNPGGVLQTLSTPGTPPTAFGVNARVLPRQSFQSESHHNQCPLGSKHRQRAGINFNGLVVDFYVGTDRQDHSFMANVGNALNGLLTSQHRFFYKTPTPHSTLSWTIPPSSSITAWKSLQ